MLAKLPGGRTETIQLGKVSWEQHYHSKTSIFHRTPYSSLFTWLVLMENFLSNMTEKDSVQGS